MDTVELYYHVYPGYDHVFQYILHDLRSHENCEIVTDIFKFSYARKMWEKIINHPTLNRKINFLTTELTRGFIKITKQISYCDIFVFSNIAVQYVPISILKRIKKKGGKLVLYFLDDIANVNSNIAFDKLKRIDFDVVCTFDKKNAEEYGFTHVYSMYSRLNDSCDDTKYGAVFIGSDKGRFTIIEEIFNWLSSEGIDGVDSKDRIQHFFSVFQTSGKHVMKYDGKMRFNQSLDYCDVVKIVKQSNCIIDIVIGEQSGLSLRAYEAIAYNKKLITNNSAIKDFPYYDERYMRYFSDVKDIDVSFVEDVDVVDYGYTDEYSPWNFLCRVSQML